MVIFQILEIIEYSVIPLEKGKYSLLIIKLFECQI